MNEWPHAPNGIDFWYGHRVGYSSNYATETQRRVEAHDADVARARPRPMPMSRDHDILVGDLITVAGVFRDGTMDEHRQHIADNVQVWRVAEQGGARLLPVLPSGAPDVHSYWYGRSTGIVTEYGTVGLVSSPSREVNGIVRVVDAR